jgi:glucosamine kinase
MRIVADAGATKIDWGIIDAGKEPSGNADYFSTIGINPYFFKSEEIVSILTKEIPSNFDRSAVSEIFYYGAGCSSEGRIKRVYDALKVIYPNAEIVVNHDLLGAAIALCGNSKGIACILGTGSNACLYDGKNIINQHGGIGFILGDEGSGAHLGKLFIQQLFYKNVPEVLKDDFYKVYKLRDEEIIDNIYMKPYPNRFLASFSPFFSKHIDNSFIENIVLQSFNDFFSFHVKHFKNYKEYPFNAVGSIAIHFEKQLNKVIADYEMKPGRFIEKPIDYLVKYYS